MLFYNFWIILDNYADKQMKIIRLIPSLLTRVAKRARKKEFFRVLANFFNKSKLEFLKLR